MTSDGYFDIRTLASPEGGQIGCPVSGCVAPLGTADSQWGSLPYCPTHRIRLHSRTRTFVYYNGSDNSSQRDAALRNILFERDHFRDHILGNAAKAETHRICHETSEDALTWNVFSRLARDRSLHKVLSTFAGRHFEEEPELYLWGLRVRLDDSSPPSLFPALESARNIFEKGINKFVTEPDIMLYVPGQTLVLIEAKFTSGNTIALTNDGHDADGEKPKSREGLLRRYSPALLGGALAFPPPSGPFYSQLYRNLVFAIHMADRLDVAWGLVSLVSEAQCARRRDMVEYQDPTPSVHALLPEESRKKFLFYSWEALYRDHIAPAKDQTDLAEYMNYKSANGAKALSI